MTKGSCDPFPELFNYQTLAVGDGSVVIDIRYGWDGVSVFPDCVGPIDRVQINNTGADTWYLKVPRATKAGFRLYTLAPGFTATFTGGQLASRGITSLADIGDLNFTREP